MGNILLTFDDGPHKKYTELILDILKKFNIKSTFFIIGQEINGKEYIINRIIKEGHEIGNHTYDHKYLANCNEYEIIDTVKKTQDILYNEFKYIPRFFRGPYGVKTINNVNIIVEKLGLKAINWHIDSYDWKLPRLSTDDVVNHILNNINENDNNVILFHDFCSEPNLDETLTMKVLNIIIPILINKNYNFKTLGEIY